MGDVCYQCGKSLSRFWGKKAYFNGCSWQNPFCSKKCLNKYNRSSTEFVKLEIDENGNYFYVEKDEGNQGVSIE